jgi:hypothetical protein
MIVIAIEIIADRLDGLKLSSRELRCASANMVMTGADLTTQI